MIVDEDCLICDSPTDILKSAVKLTVKTSYSMEIKQSLDVGRIGER